MTESDIRTELENRGFPIPEGVLTDLRWKAANNDWYVRVGEQWHWWDDRKDEWKPMVYAPD